MAKKTLVAKKKARPRILGQFIETQDEKKKFNPRSIRRVIYDIVVRYFKRNVTNAAQEFERVRRTHKDRGYRTEVKTEGYYYIIRDEQHLRYMHLEAIAIYLGVPVSLLLFYTRLRADQDEKENPLGKNEALLAGFARVIADATNRFKDISNGTAASFEFDDLIRWVDLYKFGPPADDTTEPIDQQPMLPGFALDQAMHRLEQSRKR